MRQMSFELLANLGGDIFVKQTSQLGNKILAANHALTPALVFAK